VGDFAIIDMKADGTLFTLDFLVPYTRIIWVHHKSIQLETVGELFVVE